MRSSSILTFFGAALAVATPLAHDRLHKKDIVYDIVTDIVWVTVTEGDVPTPPTTVHVQHTVFVNPVEASSTTSSTTTSSQQPSSTYVPPPPAPTTEAPAPAVEAPVAAPVVAPVVAAPAAAPVVAAPVVAPAPAPAVAPSAPAVSTSDNSLASTGVDNHNTCRASHSAGGVTWSDTLASYAAITAQKCVFAHDMTEGGGGYGQNIASQGSSSSDAWTLESALENAIISEWYSEESMFTNLYGIESPQANGKDFLHFTQIVWKDSHEIGCAVQACPTNNAIFPGMYTWFTVCNYSPQGNVEGHFAENVLAS